MPKYDEVEPDQHDSSPQSVEERLKLSVQFLKDLKPLKELADEEGHGFLSYLLEMTILEAQTIASGTSEAEAPRCEECGSSYDGTSRDLTT